MFPWGSTQRPVIVKVTSEARANMVAQICGHFGMHYIMGFEQEEDLTDLRKALQEKLTPETPYSECPCGSGQKFKFCCQSKLRNLDLNAYMINYMLQTGESDI